MVLFGMNPKQYHSFVFCVTNVTNVANIPKIPNNFCYILFQLLQKEVYDINEAHQKSAPKTENKVFGTRPEVEDETLNKV